MKIEIRGNDQQGCVGEPLQPFEVLVLGDDGERALGLPVRFRLINGLGAFTHRDTATDSWMGGAIAEFVPRASGEYRVDCQICDRDHNDKKPRVLETVSFTGTVAKPAPAPEPEAVPDVTAAPEAESQCPSPAEPPTPSAVEQEPGIPETTVPEQEAAAQEAPLADPPPPLAENASPETPEQRSEPAPAPQQRPSVRTGPKSRSDKTPGGVDLTLTRKGVRAVLTPPNRRQKVFIGLMAATLALVLAGVAYLGTGQSSPQTTPTRPATIDCTGASVQVKVVDGNKFVFSGCVKRP